MDLSSSFETAVLLLLLLAAIRIVANPEQPKSEFPAKTFESPYARYDNDMHGFFTSIRLANSQRFQETPTELHVFIHCELWKTNSSTASAFDEFVS